ncbi:hypothetical protein CRG98_006590 [Punica granatum]|uniref:Uncharacterized protein n=1 Tax=Punica granatum TaxID=22663 RepID=A0A2I0KX04_PUNGR|nr:hypothetical protein CRG98_006590 [Punica granatum]
MAVPEAPGGILLQGRKERNGGGARLSGSRHATTLVTGESEGHEEPLGNDGMTRHSREVVEMSGKPGKP